MRIIILVATLITSSVNAEELASCSNPEGFGYVSNFGAVPKDRSGWIPEKISSGRFKLVSDSEKLDLIYVDATGQPYSTNANSGFVKMLRVGPENYTVLAGYEGDTLELYSFVKERDGSLKMHILSSKGGNGQINKSTVMVSPCDYIKF